MSIALQPRRAPAFVSAELEPVIADPGLGSEREWLIPSIGLTLLSASFALLMIPDVSGIMPALMMLPLWLAAAFTIASIHGFFGMMSASVANPFAHIGKIVSQERHKVWMLALCVVLAGLNMIAFMWMKPLLNYMVPFWADPLLAEADHLLFLGNDPWALLTWLNSTPMAIFYHRGWFAMMILTLIVVAKAPPSPEKSALMLSYFVLWSLVGPIIHSLVPAAGPIFFANMGYGDRFAQLQGIPETRQLAVYLWNIYSGSGFGAGSGISAMPSMHLATTGWMVIAFHVCARKWQVPMALAGLLIFLLSISLGWHYAVDGLVGAGSALLCYRLLRTVYNRKRDRDALCAHVVSR